MNLDVKRSDISMEILRKCLYGSYCPLETPKGFQLLITVIYANQSHLSNHENNFDIAQLSNV